MPSPELSEDQYDALRALQVSTEGAELGVGVSAEDVATNLTMVTMTPSYRVRYPVERARAALRELVELGLIEELANGNYQVLDAGYAWTQAAMDEKVQQMRERIAAGLPLFDD